MQGIHFIFVLDFRRYFSRDGEGAGSGTGKGKSEARSGGRGSFGEISRFEYRRSKAASPFGPRPAPSLPGSACPPLPRHVKSNGAPTRAGIGD